MSSRNRNNGVYVAAGRMTYLKDFIKKLRVRSDSFEIPNSSSYESAARLVSDITVSLGLSEYDNNYRGIGSGTYLRTIKSAINQIDEFNDLRLSQLGEYYEGLMDLSEGKESRKGFEAVEFLKSLRLEVENLRNRADTVKEKDRKLL